MKESLLQDVKVKVKGFVRIDTSIPRSWNKQSYSAKLNNEVIAYRLLFHNQTKDFLREGFYSYSEIRHFRHRILEFVKTSGEDEFYDCLLLSHFPSKKYFRSRTDCMLLKRRCCDLQAFFVYLIGAIDEFEKREQFKNPNIFPQLEQMVFYFFASSHIPKP